ncbi:DDE_3 domain-containing protein [Trichonephila clavipes]|nr:DDE_3 domain-containing protein [Trichonephila clavipes]
MYFLHTFIWRELGIRYLPSNVREIDHYNSRSLIVWAGISLDGRTFHYVFARGIVTAVRSRDEVLVPYVCLFTGAVSPDFISADGNARHVDLMCSMNFWKVRIFAKRIGQLDLQISFILSMPETFRGGQLKPPKNHSRLENRVAEGLGLNAPKIHKFPYFCVDAMRVSVRLWGMLFHSSRGVISTSRTISEGSDLAKGVVRKSPRHTGLGQENMLAIP